MLLPPLLRHSDTQRNWLRSMPALMRSAGVQERDRGLGVPLRKPHDRLGYECRRRPETFKSLGSGCFLAKVLEESNKPSGLLGTFKRAFH